MDRHFEIDLFQINLGHRRAAAFDLQMRTNRARDFISLVQEPWFAKRAVRGLNSSHRQIITPVVDPVPRAMIYHHRDSRISPCSDFLGRDVACGLWSIGMPNLPQIMLISVYWDSKKPSLPSQFLRCLQWCAEKRIPVHIGAVFNALDKSVLEHFGVAVVQLNVVARSR